MKRLLLPIIAAIHLCGLPQFCAAEEPSNAVVKLYSLKGSSCGSGFFSDNGATITTNLHVAELLCQGVVCPGVIIEGADGTSSSPMDLSIFRKLPALDIAVLRAPPEVQRRPGLTFRNSSVLSGEILTLLGFPACGPYAVTKGAAGAIDAITFSSGAQGASGSSGGPVVDAQGLVVGVAFQSDSLLRATFDKFFGGSFTLRALRGDLIARLLQSSSDNDRSDEYSTLLSYAQNELRHATGLPRIRKALFFLNAANVVATTTALESVNPELLRSATLLEHFPGSIAQISAPAPKTLQGIIFERLIFAANIEYRGPLSSFTSRINPGKLSQQLHAQGRATSDIEALLALLPTQTDAQMPGLVPLGAIAGLGAASVALLGVLLWSWSLGFVFARTRGGILKRIFIMISVALLWPFSLVVFVILAKRS